MARSETAKILKDRLQSRSERFIELTRTKKFGLVVTTVLSIAVVAIIVSGPPEEALEPVETVSAPINVGSFDNDQGVDLPVYDTLSGIQESDRVKTPKGRGGKSVVKLSGPTIVKRPRDLSIIPGTLAKAVLLIGASNGLVKAALTEAVAVNGEELIEAGAVFLGTGRSSEERLFIRFNKVVFQDGSMTGIQADAADAEDKITGLKGSMFSSKALNIAGSVGLSFVGGLADGFQDTQVQGGVAVRPPSTRNALLNATSTTALEQSRNLMSDLKSKTPVIEVPEGTPIYILFGQEGS